MNRWEGCSADLKEEDCWSKQSSSLLAGYDGDGDLDATYSVKGTHADVLKIVAVRLLCSN